MREQSCTSPAYESAAVSADLTTHSTNTPSGFQVGVEPVPRVHTIENHDEAYHIWREARVADRTLVHIDAHPDLNWSDDDSSVNISSFISRAIAHGLVKEVYWIIPDASWRDAGRRKALVQHMQGVLSNYPGSHVAPRVDGDEMSMEALGARIRIRPLQGFPKLEESVLLDLDTDFLLIPQVPDEEGRRPSKLPWCWPDELIASLVACRLRADIVTIAYSVEGGFTPLRWKYLGDELASRISQPLQAFANPLWTLKRRASIAQVNGQLEQAEQVLTQVLALDPHNASSYFHLAHLYAEQGNSQQARAYYRRAVAEDPSYGTAYNSEALLHVAYGDLDQAERECRRTLACNPEDACAHYALGKIAATRRQWTPALEHLRHAIQLHPQFLEAYRTLAKVLERAGRLQEAIIAYEQALTLSCTQAFTLNDRFISSRAPFMHRVDRKHFELYRRLARLYSRQCRFHDALSSHRIWLASAQGGRLLDRLWLVWMSARHFRLRETLRTACAALTTNTYRPVDQRRP